MACSQILRIDAHNDVFTTCKEFKSMWKEIGLSLGIRTSSLDAIYVNEKECGRCMLEMIAVWLKRDSVKQPNPTWRGLCLAIAGVDRIAAQRISRDHPCQCSYCTGINPEEEEKQLFLPQMCRCGKCTVIDWMQGRFCLERGIEYFPKFILLPRHSPILSTLSNCNVTLQAETEEVIKAFNLCCFLTMENLHLEVNGSLYDRKRWIPLPIDEIVRLLQNRLGLHVPEEIASFHQLNNYLQSIRVSRFNFKPIALISKVFLNALYPELHKKWLEYFCIFYKYCCERRLKDCPGILFNRESDNIFILQVDETYYDMMLSDISLIEHTTITIN